MKKAFNLPSPYRIHSKPVIFPRIDFAESGQSPFWSVVIMTFRRPVFLAQAVSSALAARSQARSIEIIVVEAAPEAQDSEIITRKFSEQGVSYRRLDKNFGVGQDWNLAIAHATGTWIHLLHDDDMVTPDFYTQFEPVIDASPGVSMLFCRAIGIDANGNHLQVLHDATERKTDSPYVIEDALDRLVLTNFIVPTSVVMPRKTYEQTGGFPPGFGFCSDWLKWCQIARTGTIVYIPKPMLLYRQHDQSSTQQNQLNFMQYFNYFETLDYRLSLQHNEANRAQVRQEALKVMGLGMNSSRKSCHRNGLHANGLIIAWRMFQLHSSWSQFIRLVQSFGCFCLGLLSAQTRKSSSSDSAR